MDLEVLTAVEAAVAAVGGIAAAMISWLIYRQQRSVNSPGAKLKAELVGRNGGYVFTVDAALDPPGSPPRGIREVRVIGPPGAELSRYRGSGASWGRGVRFELAEAEAYFHCRVSSPERQILRVRLKVGRWSWIQAGVEIADYFWLAESNR